MQGSFGSAKELGARRKENPKYSKVKSQTRTGRHVNNTKLKVDRRGELFKRIGRSTLAALVRKRAAEMNESIYDLENADILSVTTIGDADELAIKAELVNVDFILADMRDLNDYHTCHIDGAVPFPHVMVSRDQIPKEIYKFKARKNCIIVVYFNEESKQAKELASTLVNKGFINVCLLTGGIKYFAEKFGLFLTGDVPLDWDVEKGEEFWSDAASEVSSRGLGTPTSVCRSPRSSLGRAGGNIIAHRSPSSQQRSPNSRGGRGSPQGRGSPGEMFGSPGSVSQQGYR